MAACGTRRWRRYARAERSGGKERKAAEHVYGRVKESYRVLLNIFDEKLIRHVRFC